MTEPLQLSYAGPQIPHVIIEVNQQCNISCRACYKSLRSYRKPLAQIKAEIDVARGARALDLITFAGGEPSLHPELPQAIAYAARFAKTNMLSNGLALTPSLLRQYRRAGLTLICLHVDALQCRPDVPGSSGAERPRERDLNALRDELCRRIRRAGIASALSVTLTRGRVAELPDVLNYLFTHRAPKGLLITCYQDFGQLLDEVRGAGRWLTVLGGEYTLDEAPATGRIAGDSQPGEVCHNADVERLLARRYGLEPDFYVASNLDAAARRWLVYLVLAIAARDGALRLLPLSARAKRAFLALDDLVARALGRRKFLNDLGPFAVLGVCLLSALLSLSPRHLLRTLRFLGGLLRPGARPLLKDVVVQEAPRLTESGELEHCESCFDATVRDGRLVPVCLADILAPIPASSEVSSGTSAGARA